MGIPNLKAIRDWCIGKFQPKGEYLTSIPSGYVTNTELSEKNYTTMEEVEEKYVPKESLGGMTFGVDADGNYGYIKAGADTVIPFIQVAVDYGARQKNCMSLKVVIGHQQ